MKKKTEKQPKQITWFYTILSELGLENRVASSDLSNIQAIIKTEIEWEQVDLKLSEFRNRGYLFLKKICE